jgi:hypothetical protein
MTTTIASGTSVEHRVKTLARLAEQDQQAAQDAAWGWFQRLGDQLPAEAADAELSQIFNSGKPGEAVDGQTEGVLLGWTSPAYDLDRGGRIVTAFARRLTNVHVPWVGKRFDGSAQRGTNSLTRVARLAKLIAPTYRFTRGDVHLEGFEMTNWVEPGRVDPNTEVYVIDYESAGNPWPFKYVRDELVEILPNTYLGKMLWRQGAEHRLMLYFALKTPVRD